MVAGNAARSAASMWRSRARLPTRERGRARGDRAAFAENLPWRANAGGARADAQLHRLAACAPRLWLSSPMVAWRLLATMLVPFL